MRRSFIGLLESFDDPPNVILPMGMGAMLLLMASLFIWTIIALPRGIGGLL